MINCIVAVEKNQGIGYEGFMPWPNLKEDLKFFKNITSNNVIIMGSTTYKSIGKSLPNRINVVLSSNKTLGDHTFSDSDNALAFCLSEYPDKDIFIIGGENVYKQFLLNIDKYYITEIENHYICDRFFNVNYVKNNFTKVTEIAKFNDPINYQIKSYERQ